jgi:regulator of RNase E activity RraA
MQEKPKISKEIIEAYCEVSTASIADVLWEQGISAHMSHEVRSVAGGKIVGPGVTILEEPTQERVPPQLALELIDRCAPGSVLLIGIHGNKKDVAVWGGLMTAGAVVNRLAGAVLDGGVRDLEEIRRDYDFPIFARSVSPASTVGRFKTVAVNEPTEVGGVLVHPGDLIVGDLDGVVVVPSDWIEKALGLAEEIELREREQRKLIEESKSLIQGIERYKRI